LNRGYRGENEVEEKIRNDLVETTRAKARTKDKQKGTCAWRPLENGTKTARA